MDKLGSYDVVVIGAGHAGIEAAHAAATLGARTAVFTLSLDFIGNMPCNPSIGGTAKGHLVREVDALGGLMGIAADATFLQSRMLNRGKGPAVHSLRVQTDRKRYHMWMKHALEKTPNLDIHQAEIVAVDIQEGKVCGIITNLNGYYSCKALVIATGGGCVTQPRNYPMLHQNGVIFWLKRDISKLPTDGRPLSQASPLDAMFAKRAPMYAAFADHAVSNDGTAEETVAAILSIMEEPI